VPLEPLLASVAGRGPGTQPIDLDGMRRSAVLVALYDGERGAEVVLTRRAQHMRNHKGEVSFPGGRLDPGETPRQAALREAHEEVCLEPSDVEVIGELDHLVTVVSRSHIVPIVGRLRGRPDLRAGTSEVDRILHVPLAELLRSDTYLEEHWGTGPLERSLHFFHLDDETIWGATGRVLVQLLSIATGVAA
jgi:mutator protein MutT